MTLIPFNSSDAEKFYRGFDENSVDSIPVFSGVKYQQGYGLGNIFSGLIKAAIPIVKKGAISLGKTALDTGLNIARDKLAGKDFKTAFKDNIKSVGYSFLNNSSNLLKPNRRNKKRKRSSSTVSSRRVVKAKRPRLKKKSVQDLFTK